MYLIYSIGLLCSLLLAAPYFLYQMLVHKKYWNSLAVRLGLAKRNISSFHKRLLIHSVSVGEFIAAQPLIEQLHRKLPDYCLVISTTTATAQALAQERIGSFASVCYFPLDFGFAVRQMLDEVKPEVIIILETEIWPNFLHIAAKRKIPLIVANGRISDKSFRRYQWIHPFLRQVLGNVTHFLMQSTQDAERISALGAPSRRVSVGGNIKYDLTGELPTHNNLARELVNALSLAKDGLLLVAGSTAAGEELLLLNTYRQLLCEPTLANTRLLLAPRHPERFDEVAALIKAHHLPFIRRSELMSSALLLTGKSDLPPILLLDSIGELAATYRYADLVFVGGSLVPRGGHNILEPALYGRAIITGPYTYNFRHIMQDFINAKAVVQIAATEQGELEQSLFTELVRLLTGPQLREELGERALAVLKSNRGALEKHTQLITKVIENPLV